ncbi:unnamed protein product, partial [Adineta steineri]
DKIHCTQDQEYILTTSNLIDKYILIIKNLIKKVIDNKDVFEGRFRKLQTLLLASREKQQKFQLELNEFSNFIRLNLTSTNIIPILKDYYQMIEELKSKEEIATKNNRILEEQLMKVKVEERAERLKCIFLTKQLKKLNSKTK